MNGDMERFAIGPQRKVYLRPFDDVPEEPCMRFRLVYEGPLQASQGEARNGQRVPLAAQKHAIRREFHKQLKQLWSTNKFLRDQKVEKGWTGPPSHPTLAIGGAKFGLSEGTESRLVPLSEAIAELHKENGYRFVPLVREDFSLFCSLDILFLRRDFPIGVISSGDLDNRIKTLIDGLRKPKGGQELVGNETPTEDEDPFYCLLEDDDLVTGLKVETDMLLFPLSNGSNEQSDVKLIISVEIRPDHVTMFNLNFS